MTDQITVSRELLQQVMAFCEAWPGFGGKELATALRTALEQPAVEPVAIVVDPYDTPGVHTNGKPLAMLGVDQLRDENKELRQEVEMLRNGMFNIANQSTEPAIQEFARSYLGDKL